MTTDTLSHHAIQGSVDRAQAERFRSNWMAIIVHGLEGIPVLVFFLAVSLGLVG